MPWLRSEGRSRQLPYRTTSPPSIVIMCPTTNEALSEQSQMTASAISSGWAVRPIGCQLSASAFNLGLLA